VFLNVHPKHNYSGLKLYPMWYSRKRSRTK